MTDKSRIAKYTNPGSPVVIVIVNNISIENTLINLGSNIDMMTTTPLKILYLGQFLRPTLSILELEDCTTVKPARLLDDIII